MLTLTGSYGETRNVIHFSSEEKQYFTLYKKEKRGNYDMRLSFDGEDYTFRKIGCWTTWVTVRKYQSRENLCVIKRTVKQSVLGIFQFILHDGTTVYIEEKAGLINTDWDLKYGEGLYRAKFVFKSLTFNIGKNAEITVNSTDHPLWKLIIGLGWFMCYEAVLTRRG